MDVTEKYDEYVRLSKMTYAEAVSTLLEKYGSAEHNYFTEAAYDKFLSGVNKTLTKAKGVSRIKEGLYCHHIDEIKALNLSNPRFIMHYRYPYAYQLKEQLVYCNLIEHLILHALITYETKRQFGFPGFQILAQQVNDWYVQNHVPGKTNWQYQPYLAAYLPKDLVEKLNPQLNRLVNLGATTTAELQQILNENKEA
ncbi:hypothetical protein [Fructilactobacillus frigidiflavus]|uniref:hypothetical protein n=1 Tax=Fructilactobacillus frigidiflavus TaxID=3242688 RepID=UPI003756E643